MTTTIDSQNISLKDLYRVLKLEMRLNNSFISLLTIESLTEVEQQELEKLRNKFDNYYSEAKISECKLNSCLSLLCCGYLPSTIPRLR